MTESTSTTAAAWHASALHRGGNLGLLLLRIALGAIFIVHGGQKLFGLFGGFGLEGTGQFFSSFGANPGYFWAVVVGIVEFLGGIALILGLFTRVAAVALAVDMLVAIVAFKWGLGFSETTGGWEYNLTLLAALLAIALVGAGSLSISAGAASRAQGRLKTVISQA